MAFPPPRGKVAKPDEGVLPGQAENPPHPPFGHLLPRRGEGQGTATAAGVGMTPLGARLRAMRRERGIALKDMAMALRVSPAYLSALEHGRRGTPTFVLLQRIIHFFGVIWDEAEELQRLAEISDPKVVVDTAGMAPEATEFANRLAADIGKLGTEDLLVLRTELVKRAKPQ